MPKVGQLEFLKVKDKKDNEFLKISSLFMSFFIVLNQSINLSLHFHLLKIRNYINENNKSKS